MLVRLFDSQIVLFISIQQDQGKDGLTLASAHLERPLSSCGVRIWHHSHRVLPIESE